MRLILFIIIRFVRALREHRWFRIAVGVAVVAAAARCREVVGEEARFDLEVRVQLDEGQTADLRGELAMSMKTGEPARIALKGALLPSKAQATAGQVSGELAVEETVRRL